MNYTVVPSCFSQDSQPALLVNPVDPPSQPALPIPVNPVDLNHSLTVLKPSIPLTLENAIATNQPITEDMVKKVQLRDVAPKMFEALGFSKPLPWWNGKDWTAFGEWVCTEYDQNRISFGEYNIWRNTKYSKGGISNNRLRGFPNEFYDSWDMFLMSKGRKTDETKPEYKVKPQFDSSGRLINA